jgi:hypothetical protein
MPLLKTVTQPNPPETEPKFAEPVLKLVVLGNREPLATAADAMAQNPPTNVDRWVVWYKNPDMDALKAKFTELQDKENFKAFSLSTKNKVADIIKSEDLEDEVRVDEAFTKAGLKKFNK